MRSLHNSKASDLFKSYRIDFCCGGNKPLIDAIHERNLSATEVLTELNTLYNNMKRLNESEIDWKNASYRELIDYVINKHHRYLNERVATIKSVCDKSITCSWGKSASFSSNS